MATKTPQWSKTELQVYILLLCANADKNETEEELEMILSKVPKKLFLKIYKEFHADTEEKRLKKVSLCIQKHNYTVMELSTFRKEVQEIFLSDCDFKMLEKRLDWTLDNILY